MTRQKKPRKPTSAYGYISFAKDGKVEGHMFRLSSEKAIQEREVIESFISHFPNETDSVEILNISDLPEANQDFQFSTNHEDITVQLTEIVEREYAFKITQEEYDSGKFGHYISAGSGKIPLAVNVAQRDNVLANAIKKKHAKNYAKDDSEVLWLVIFSTSQYLTTVFSEGGKQGTSLAYAMAVNYMESVEVSIFDNIWYYDLIGRPVRIWPPE
jgi:hypothetical protein